MQRLSRILAAEDGALQLRADAAGLAPERLLVFELTGDVQNFARAAARVPGLEFLGADSLDGDEADDAPVLYLMIPDGAALRQLVSLWERWQRGAALPEGFAPWKAMFSQLRDLRAWGPEDRLSRADLRFIAEDHADADGMVRLELELVFRPQGEAVEVAASDAVRAVQGEVISRTRIEGANYHALLINVPSLEVQNILARGRTGLVASEAVMHIRPQSVLDFTPLEPQDVPSGVGEGLPFKDPIVAVFDAVPLAAHPRLAGFLSIDDPFDLEPLAVGVRIHGTAMASAIVHGDLAGPPLPTLERRIFFVNIMFAPGGIDQGERFPNRLPADLFHEAIVRMKDGQNPTAPGVIVVNASVGDRNKPFYGHMSGWARVLDYLAYRYGILFIISAGNQLDDLTTEGVNTIAFEALEAGEKARTALRASAAVMAKRRILAPAESMNAVTVGALHNDHAPVVAPLPASTFDVWHETGMCSISSGLGPGQNNAVKPEILAPGGRHHVRLMPNGTGHHLRPLRDNAGAFGGILVAAPPSPAAMGLDRTSRCVGTSPAAALMTGLAARAHESMEAVYPDFLALPTRNRALLLKAMLVHCARWPAGSDLIGEVVGPADPKQHVRRKDNIRRFLGYGAVDGDTVLDCTQDRATLWGIAALEPEGAHKFAVPLAPSMSGKRQYHEITATVAWFAPPRVGAAKYRGARFKLVDNQEAQALFGVKGSGSQPDTNQAHRGTVIHRRWHGEKAAVLTAESIFEILVQREADELEEAVPYVLIVTVTMPGVEEIYAEILQRVAVKPRIAVPAR